MKQKKSRQPKIIYYKNLLEDEFSTAEITPKTIDGSYPYERDRGPGRLACFFWYRMVATPMAYVYLKCKFRHKVVGREKLKEAQGKGIYLYGNHTQIIGDALIPTFVCMPRNAYVVVHPNNVSMPYLGRITPYMGAIPLPGDLAATRHFSAVLDRRIAEGEAVFLYPEAHIWPYYTGIRPFGENAFLYPGKSGAAVYAFTNTYHKRKHSKNPRIITYIDGPFYPDMTLSQRERRGELRDRVYRVMCERSELSDINIIEYRPMEDNT